MKSFTLLFSKPGKKEQLVLLLSLFVLFLTTVLIIGQKFAEFAAYPAYSLPQSVLFNLITNLPFVGVIYAGIKSQDLIKKTTSKYAPLLLIASALIFIPAYAFIVNGLLYILGLASSLYQSGFIVKYFSGLIQVHLILYLFVQFYIFFNTERKQTSGSITLKKGNSISRISVNSIEFVESYGHYIKIHTEQGLFIERSTMKDILERLGENFIRIHRKYIINKEKAESFCSEQSNIHIILKGKKLKVSNSYKKEVSELFSS